VGRTLRYAAVILVVTAASSFGQPPTGSAITDTATLSATLTPLAKLALSSTSLNFPDADPDTVPLVPGVPDRLDITAKARATAGATVVLTLQATDDLRSGVNIIPASAISWTATGAGFVAGTLSRTTPQTVGSWTGSGLHSGSQHFTFVNSWSYPIGTYTLSLTYTLSSP
jgi:hypothetical protein